MDLLIQRASRCLQPPRCIPDASQMLPDTPQMLPSSPLTCDVSQVPPARFRLQKMFLFLFDSKRYFKQLAQRSQNGVPKPSQIDENHWTKTRILDFVLKHNGERMNTITNFQGILDDFLIDFQCFLLSVVRGLAM